MNKLHIDEVGRRVRTAVEPLPKAVMFELAEDRHRTLLEQVVACIISVRTREEVTAVAASRLFAAAPTPGAVAALPVGRIDALIRPATFHETKASQIGEIARRVVEEFGNIKSCDEAVLRSFRDVGPKCAHLALGIARGCR